MVGCFDGVKTQGIPWQFTDPFPRQLLGPGGSGTGELDTQLEAGDEHGFTKPPSLMEFFQDLHSIAFGTLMVSQNEVAINMGWLKHLLQDATGSTHSWKVHRFFEP